MDISAFHRVDFWLDVAVDWGDNRLCNQTSQIFGDEYFFSGQKKTKILIPNFWSVGFNDKRAI